MPKRGGQHGMAGARPKIMEPYRPSEYWAAVRNDEILKPWDRDGVPVVRERLPAEGVVIPPYGQDHHNTKPGDQVVILTGDQFGWRGTVRSVENVRGQITVVADMRRLDGSKASTVTHRGEYVGRILKEVPRFDHPEDADAWLEGQLREPVQEWATGVRVVFSSPPHLAVRLAFRREVAEDGLAKREWLQRFDDMEAEGRVTKFMPYWETEQKTESAFPGHSRHQTVPGYELLVTLDGEPALIEVAARRIKRLA